MTLTTHRHREVAEGPAPGEALQIGRYVVLGRLGEGAMGVVYRAYDELLDRKVALKLLQHTGRRDGPARVRLQREAQALAQLSHPNVVQIYDVGEWNGEDFVALEFVRGQTLTTWLIERPRPWQAIVEVFVQAGRGLAAAHAADLVHRDFKPDNILVGVDGRVRVADFGLALPMSPDSETQAAPQLSQSGRTLVRVTVAGALIGTPAYMAPEQFLHRPADARSDQFSFDSTLRRFHPPAARNQSRMREIAGLISPAFCHASPQDTPAGLRGLGENQETDPRGLRARAPAASGRAGLCRSTTAGTRTAWRGLRRHEASVRRMLTGWVSTPRHVPPILSQRVKNWP